MQPNFLCLAPRARTALSSAGFAVLAITGLLAANGDAEAGYTCVDNITQVGNSVTIVVTATSGGALSTWCHSQKSIQTSPASIPISGSVLGAQVGATNGLVRIDAEARTQGLGFDFGVSCNPPSSSGACSSSNSGTINGVDFVSCTVRGDNNHPIPDPALPAVPVVITGTCTINY